MSVQATDAENADRSLETLGLAPDLSSLSREVVDLIRYRSHDRHLGCSEDIVAVCVELLWADYGVAEIWMILTDPNNGISEAFFSKDGKQAEAWLEWIVCEAYKEVNRSEHGDE